MSRPRGSGLGPHPSTGERNEHSVSVVDALEQHRAASLDGLAASGVPIGVISTRQSTERAAQFFCTEVVAKTGAKGDELIERSTLATSERTLTNERRWRVLDRRTGGPWLQPCLGNSRP